MTLFKIGQAFNITESDIHTTESVLSDPQIEEHFRKYAAELKRIAPKASDFLYFSAVMMHAAEACLINNDGTPKKLSNGQNVTADWEKKGDSWRWVSNDPTVKPYKNSNGDIFPEEELLKAYKKWVGRPLCLDHKSSSVEFTRGIIVDTYYDRAAKRVIALCALDKVNYPDLARKVATGYAASVSMGTAVGKAVCTDCGAVARTEQDFCHHMRTKSSYGEINLDLSPIELSIVVNGADPAAKIKHIIASANALNSYAEQKQQELKSLAESSNKDKVNEIKDKIVDDIKKGLDSLIREFDGINESNTDEKSEAAPSDEAAADNYKSTDTEQSPDFLTSDMAHRVTASEEVDSDELTEKFTQLKTSIESKLANIQEDFIKLLKLNGESRNTNMDKKAYFQGTEEPKPGQAQYPVDPGEAKSRNEHKHMVNIQDTGPVDGMHPGDLEKKKLLARAEVEARNERRKVAVEMAKQALTKGAYYQGTEEPTAPGKPQYAVDPGEEKSRKEHKHMQGQPPFPGVGKVDGLHPSPASADEKDELKRKEMLARASLKAKFVKAAKSDGTDDRANSAWQVFANDKLVLSASVKELSAGRVDALYDVIATREFATKMLEKIKTVGFDKAAKLYKAADDAGMPAMPAAPAASPAPAPDMAMPPMPAGDLAAPEGADAGAEDAAAEGGSGDPKENLLSNLEETRTMLNARLSDAVDMSKALLDEKGEMEPAAVEMPKAASSLHKMRIELNAALTSGIRKNANELRDHQEELNLIEGLYQSGNVNEENREYVESLAQEAIDEARTTLAETMELFSAFVKYAKGTEAMLKRAEADVSLGKNADEDLSPEMLEPMGESDLAGPSADEKSDEELMQELNELASSMDADDVEADAAAALDTEVDPEVLASADENMADAEVTMKKEDLAKLPAGVEVEHLKTTAQFDLSTREGRTAYRAKLAADSMKTSPHLGEAHKHVQDHTKLDTKPSGDLGKIETIEDTHKAMLDLANAPPKVRKEAAEIMKLVKAGKLNPADVDSLVSHGVDPEAVKYWKGMWKEVEGGGEFASEMLKEHAKAEAEEELKNHKVKLARAYDLAYQMVERGIVANDREAIASQVDEIMTYNDQAFDSLKKVVARHAPKMTKEAGRIPVVGLIGSDNSDTAPAAEPDDIFSGLSKAFANRRY